MLKFPLARQFCSAQNFLIGGVGEVTGRLLLSDTSCRALQEGQCKARSPVTYVHAEVKLLAEPNRTA